MSDINTQLFDVLKNIEGKLDNVRDELAGIKTSQAVFEHKLSENSDRHKELEQRIKNHSDFVKTNFVTKDEFRPIKRIYTIAATAIATAIIAALVSMVVVKPEQISTKRVTIEQTTTDKP